MNNSPQRQHRSIHVPHRGRAAGDSHVARSHQAAQQIMRDQIDKIYDEQSPGDDNVYHKTHQPETAVAHASHDAAWQQYHTSWQSYYQQYYERYYLAQLRKQSQRSNAPATTTTTPEPTPAHDSAPPVVTRDQAIRDIRAEIIEKTKHHARTVRRNRHFVPIASALAVALIVGLLQYNRVLVANVRAYVSPGAISAQNIVLDPSLSTSVGPEPKLIIPKINVEAPIVYDVGSLQDAPVQKALERGVVHYPLPGANARPGQVGNNVVLGHSSNDVFDNGGYKFVFVQLDKLSPGDTIYNHYNGTRYTYRVTEKYIIEPTEINRLTVPTEKPIISLVTCTPPGTALRRLVVVAEQVNPDPAAATTAPSNDGGQSDVVLPGNSETLLQRLF